ncbi:TfpX/TfpZ family type IV pilin accessory protein [Rhodoferax sp. GW822-FHT02A01]|uniref:TfpX/TfpZ family type IV pilin accessory protein n=1 Tax=Rhodoferax sp. GW822-FHT02A01 TaxID=3141537 RepID=UPI00315DE341
MDLPVVHTIAVYCTHHTDMELARLPTGLNDRRVSRIKAAAIHLLISLGIAALAAALVFGIWYPYPYREISGGRELFFLVVTVDVIMGPLITLTLFNPKKKSLELRVDLTIVAILQLLALTYGLWTVYEARPVHLVFEGDRFRVVHAVDISTDLLQQVPQGINALPLTGPTMLGLREFRDQNEKMQYTMAAIQGVQLAFRPDLWQPYSASVSQVLKASKPVSELTARFPKRASNIEAVLSKVGRNGLSANYLPLIGRDKFWTAFLDPVTAEVIATMPLDSF